MLFSYVEKKKKHYIQTHLMQRHGIFICISEYENSVGQWNSLYDWHFFDNKLNIHYWIQNVQYMPSWKVHLIYHWYHSKHHQ